MDALEAGAHVVVEKPAAPAYADVEALVARARRNGRNLVEDYNYLFNPPVRRLCQLVESGQVGAVVHVEVLLSVDLGRSSGVTDYVTHLASLVHAFVGPHRRVAVTRRDDRELRAMVEGEEASAAVCFSGDTRPDAFTVRVHGTRLRATAQLFEPALVVERDRPGLSRPLVPVVNGLSQSATVARAAVGGVVGKLSGGPGSYAGLWELVRATYRAFGAGAPPPVSLGQVLAVNRLVAGLSGEENG
jgi:predicted dehydrogenase